MRYIDPTGHLSWDQVKKGWDEAKAKIAEPVTNLANQGRQLIGAIEGAVDRGKVSFGEMAAVQFVGRLAQEPERIATDIKDLLTPGRRHDGSTGGLVRQRQIAQLEAAEKLPIVDRIGATLDAWGLQPAVAAEEGFARPVAQIPGQLGSVQQHLEQAARSNDGVDRMVHLAAATRDGAQATTSALAIAAMFEGGATPRRASGAPEMAPYRATQSARGAAAGDAAAASVDTGAARQTMAMGKEWYDYFAGQYGASNVDWVSGSGRTIEWPSQLPKPAAAEMLRVRPPARSGAFLRELEGTAGPRPPDNIGHHVQPLFMGGSDTAVGGQGAWLPRAQHQAGHSQMNATVIPLPFGTWIIPK